MSNLPKNGVLDDDEWLNAVPKWRFWEEVELYQWEGFWISSSFIGAAVAFRSNFKARNDDVFLASPIKTGTTWLKALALCITRKHFNGADDILALENPHFHVPTVEIAMITNKTHEINIEGDNIASAPRLLHTHMPYTLIPDSIKQSNCRIIYIARNPKDTLISMWHFMNSILRRNRDPFPLEKAVDSFCSGSLSFGPFFEHVAEYWRESKKRPEKILFVKYEDLKSEPKREVSKIADFLGMPFRDEGETDEVLHRCSLGRLKNLEVNKSDRSLFTNVPNSYFFRKGEVGDWKNYLTPQMEERIDQITREKLNPFGLFL